MRRSLFIVTIVALLTAGAWGGEIKFHNWPCVFLPQEIAEIPVVMDVGFFIEVKNQNARIKLAQETIQLYSGCTDLQIATNIDIELTCSIQPTGAIPGNWSCSVTPSALEATPGGTVQVCAQVENPDLSKTPGGSTNVNVAIVSLKVVPTAL